MRIVEVIPSRHWFNRRTGQRASVYGAVPYYGEADKADWQIVTAGWTWKTSAGTIGLGRAAVDTIEEAEAVMHRINAL